MSIPAGTNVTMRRLQNGWVVQVQTWEQQCGGWQAHTSVAPGGVPAPPKEFVCLEEDLIEAVKQAMVVARLDG